MGLGGVAIAALPSVIYLKVPSAPLFRGAPRSGEG